MGTLHVRNVPKRVHDRLRKMAKEQRRSLTAEVIAILERATANEALRARRARILDEIRRERFTPPPGTPTAEEMIREDRER
ncbi:Arc family DNA-binding protein [bacterium]|nr:Arc family DNA-binding protein [bacterium]